MKMMKQQIVIWATVLSFSCHSKDNKDVMPLMTFLMIDSTTTLSTNDIPGDRPIVLMYFSPDCDHCQKQTEDLIKNIHLFKETYLCLITNDPLERLKVYKHHYNIGRYKNILLAIDYKFQFIKYFKPNTTPFIAVYSNNKYLKAVFPGGAPAKKLLDAANSL